MSKRSKRADSEKKRRERRSAKAARMQHKALEKSHKDNLSVKKTRTRQPEPNNVGDYKVYEKQLLPGLARILLAEYDTETRQYTSGLSRTVVRDYILKNMKDQIHPSLYAKVRQKQALYAS